MKPITENHIEQYAIEELQALGYGYVYGPEIEREDFGQVVLVESLRRQVAVINPDIPDEAREQAIQKALRIFSPDLLANNETFHEFLIEKVRIPYQKDGFERSHEVEHVLGLPEGKERFAREVALLGQAFALSLPQDAAMKIAESVAFFQAVKARLVKFEGTGTGRSDVEIETAIKQIVDSALSSDKVVDIFEAAGIEKPEISILSDEFLLEVKGMKHKNLALELLKKILNDEIKTRAKTNLVKSKALLEMLEGAVKRYQNNLLSTAEIIEELIRIANEVKESDKQGERLGLTADEVAFYNALEVNESAVQVLGDETLRDIAREIADKVRNNNFIDWTIRESARANLMRLVSRTLRKHGYPPDKQQTAVDTILKQAELIADLTAPGRS